MANAREYMEFDFDPRKIPDTHALAVGRVSLCWTQTENIIEDVIAALARLSGTKGWAITSHMNFPMKCDALLSVSGLTLDGEDQESLRLVIARLKILSEARNRYVHSYWAVHEGTGDIYITAIKARGKLKADHTKVALEDIETTAASIYQVGIDLLDFILKRGIFPIEG